MNFPLAGPLLGRYISCIPKVYHQEIALKWLHDTRVSLQDLIDNLQTMHQVTVMLNTSTVFVLNVFRMPTVESNRGFLIGPVHVMDSSVTMQTFVYMIS